MAVLTVLVLLTFFTSQTIDMRMQSQIQSLNLFFSELLLLPRSG